MTLRAVAAGLATAIMAFAAHAQPVPGFTPAPTGGGDILIDAGYGATACFDNLSPTATGYFPTIQAVVPAGSTLGGATFAGSAQTIQTIGTCATVGGCPTQFVNPNTGAAVPLAQGETLSIVRMSLGSFAPAQPPACVAMSLDLGNSTAAPPDITRNLRLTPIFAYGADALDNPTTDPPLVGSTASLPVTPRLLTVRKTINAPEGETATGRNYPRTVRVEVGVATGETITNLNVTDTLPGTLQFVIGSQTFTGCPGSIVDTGTPTGGVPGETIGRQCTTITGNGTANQLVLQFQVFVPQNDSGGAPVITPAAPTRVITNTANASGTYDPPGAPPPMTVNGSGSANITAKLAPIRKSVSIAVDNGANGPSRTDVLRYRLEYELSDFFSVSMVAGGALTFVDTLGDGQTFMGCADAGTTFSAFGENLTVPASPFGAACASSGKNPTTGETTITFNVGSALQGNFGLVLDGDIAHDNVLSAPTRIVVEFLATIDVQYSATPFPGPGSPAIGVDDVVGNAVTSNTTSGGQSAPDSSSASTTIGGDAFAKSVYAYNGIVPPPPGFLVAAGDTVTFRVRWDISVASFDQGVITDYLPGPLFRTTGFSAAGHAATAGTGTPPPAGNWTTGPADNFTSVGAVVADVAPIVAISGTNNSITWDYGTRALAATTKTVDLLITVLATQEPFGDGLNFTNVAALTFENSVGGVSSAGGTGAITTRAPDVTIAKSIVASSNPACITGTPPANFDAARTACDANDTIDFRLTLANRGRAPALNVRVDDDQGLPAGGFGASCTVLSVTDGAAAPVATTGSLFNTTANGGLSIAQIPADQNTAVLPGEQVLINYRCTVAPTSLPALPDRRIDNTARLKYYTNVVGQTIDPAFNFASNQAFPGPNVRRARVELATVAALTKQITASNLALTTPDSNINSGETLTFLLTLSLAEGAYQAYSFTDTNIAIPAPITCGAAGFTCTPNVSVVGTTITVAPTAGSTTGTITYTYSQAKSASGTNTVSFSATNVPASNAQSSWTMGNPAPVVSKAFNPTAADASDSVQVRLGWQNNNAANPMFQCVISDQLDVTTFNAATIAAVTTPAGYTFAATPGGLVTYTANNTLTPCPDVAPGGAVFSVSLLPTAIAGGVVPNTAILAGNTLPSSLAGGAAVNAQGSASLALGSPAINAKVIQSTTEPNAVTTNPSVAIGERVTYRVTFTMPDGVTRLVRLVDDMMGGLANMTFIAGSASLARNTTALTAANNPGNINAAAPGVFVPVTPQCVGTAPCGATQLRFDLGDVTNNPATGTSNDTYTLDLSFQVANVSANTLNSTRDNRGQLIYQPALSVTDQTVNGGVARVIVVSPVVALTKTVLVERPPSGPVANYSLTIANTASGPGAGPAFDGTFTDVLPASLTAPQLVLPLPAGVSASFAGNTLTGTVTRLDPGQQVIVQYHATVDPLTPTGSTIVNAASTAATSLPGPQGTGNATPGAPGAADGERTGAGGTNNLSAASSANFTLGTLGISKRRISAASVVAIGDEVQYEIIFTLPLGTTQNVSVTDVLSPGLGFVPGSAAFTVQGGPVTTSLPPTPPTIAGPTGTYNFGTVTATTPAQVVLTYRAIVRNVIGNQRGTILQNNASLTYLSAVTGTNVTVPAVNPPAIVVGEPNLELVKVITAGAVGSDANDPVDFRIAVENRGDTTAHRVDLRDVLPIGLNQIANVVVTTTGQVSIDGTATPVNGTHARVTTTTNTGDTLDVASLVPDGSDFISLAPGANIQVDFRATVMNTVLPGQVITNDIRVPYASRPNCPANPECRNDASGLLADDDNDALLNNYAERDQVSLTASAAVSLSKAVSQPRAVVGESVTFAIRMGLIEGTTPNLSLTDVLPAGFTYVSHNISVGNIGFSISNGGYNTRLGAGQTVTFNFGTVVNPGNGSNADDYIQVEIEARVDNVAANQDGTTLSNGEQGAGSPVSATGGVGPITIFFDADPALAGNQGVPVQVIEPALSLAKSVMPATQSLGGRVTYRLDVAHTAASTADAFDLTVVDTLPAGVQFVPGSVSPPGVFVSSVGQVLTFATGSLSRAAGSGSVTYQVDVLPTATVGAPLANNARLEWRSLSGASGAATSGRTGTGGLNDYFATATATLTPNAAATIDAVKTVAIAIDADASTTLTAGDTLEYTVTLTNTNGLATNVVFTDPTPGSTTYVPGSATTTAGTVTGTNPLVVNVGPMLPGAVVTIRFRVQVNAGTPGGTLIRNQGSVDSDQTVPEPTDVDGNDANGDQPTDILVAAGLPGTPLLRAPKTVALLVDADGSGSITQGDRMRYTISLQNLGNVPLTLVSLADTIPGGLLYVPGSATATSGAISVTGQAVDWGPVLLLPVGSVATATFDVTIISVTPPNQTYINQGTASSPQTGAMLTDGNASFLDGSQPTIFVAGAPGQPPLPILDVQKRWILGTDTAPAGTPSPGDSLVYTITVTNIGTGPATNVRLTDPTPVCSGGTPAPTCTSYVAGTLTTSQGAIIGTAPIEVNLGTLAISASATVSFQVLVNPATTSGTIVANQASITRDGTATPVLSDDNGFPSDGINPTLTPISLTPGSSPRGGVKSIVGSSEPNTISPLGRAVVGEVLRFVYVADMDEGPTAAVAIRDILPDGLTYLPGSARLARIFNVGLTASNNPGGINASPSGTPVTLADGTGITITPGAGGITTLVVNLGNVTNSDLDAGGETYQLEYRAVVANTAGVQAGTVLNNTATVTWVNGLLQPQQLPTASAGVVVIEPQITVTKSSSNGVLYIGGGQTNFTIDVTNAATAISSPAFEVRIIDILPPIFTSMTVTSITSVGATGVVDTSFGTTVQVDVARLEPSGQVRIVVQAVAPGPLTVGSVTNTARAFWSSLPGTNGSAADGVATPGIPGGPNGERIGLPGGVNDYIAPGAAVIAIELTPVIPTLSEWMLALLALLMGGVAAMRMRAGATTRR